jgi:carboxypeptidase family protein
MMQNARHELRICMAWLACLLVGGWIAPPAMAQVLYGSMTGAVQDTTGSVVPNAAVTVVNSATGQSREGITSESGTYLFSDVPAGTYVVTVAAKGFRSSRTTGVDVTINTVLRLDVQLTVGDRAETVTVEANAAAIQTDSADVHVSLGSQAVTELPLPGYRNYQALISLVPGRRRPPTRTRSAARPGAL